MRTKRILVIDDEEWLRELIHLALTQQGYEVVDAVNGEDGIDKAQKVLPDLILCDVNMSKLNGYLTLSSLREKPETKAIPFILMTGGADTGGMRHGMELGADDYLLKPFSIENLQKAVDTRIKKAIAIKEEADKKLLNLCDSITTSLPHELTTPLNGIIAYAELLKTCSESLPPDEIREMGETISESGTRLQKLIGNFLLYSQIQIMQFNPTLAEMLRKKQTPLPKKVVEDRAATVANACGRSGDLVLKLTDKPAAISEEYLSKIVEEVVSNAFKFSNPGTQVEVSLFPMALELILQVKDHGRGITAHQIRDLGLYMQFDRKRNEQQGLGFGLIISKRLTELHNGTFEIRSDASTGSIINISFPVTGGFN